MQLAGIILCGGESRRMGYPKAKLPFGGETLLQRTARTVSQVTGRIVVVAAAGQKLPELPSTAIVVEDTRPQLGPLEGLRTGLSALSDETAAAYVTSCDVPFLTAEFISWMAAKLGEADIAVPEAEGFRHPLAAVYRRSILPHIEELLAAGKRRPADLFPLVATRFVSEQELTDFDPQLNALRNLNRPEDYEAAITEAGFAVPTEVRQILFGEGEENQS